ncbi:MAG: glycosyltransferase family 2 protein [Lachnospiraceae bacterium]|jgi:glycosyltransferase involved in cell wall biosynthesis|nr:glycosyltransferase family 2 protein [Lachnospiraceae bacterium]
MEEQIKISIIIPVYNVEKYLCKCLDSALAQTIVPKEIICIDDGSTDSSCEILERYHKKYECIKVYCQENQGSGAARNFALSVAGGKYVCFLDSDDWYIDKSALEKMYNTCEENSVNICGSFRQVYNPLNSKVGKIGLHRKDCEMQPCGILMKYSDYQGDFHYHNYIFNRQMLNGRDIKFPLFRRYQDPPFFIRAMLAAGNFWVLPVELYCYRSTPKARLMDKNNDMRETLRGMCECMEIADKNHLSALKSNLVNRLITDYTRFIDEHPSDEVYGLLNKLSEYISEEEKKRTALYPFFENLLLRKNRAYIAQYLQKKGISSIAIYGLGNMGELLYSVLSDTEIEIFCGIDQKKEVFHGLPVISDFLKLPVDTVIIITPLYPLGQEIENILYENGYKRTITLTDIVNERRK